MAWIVWTIFAALILVGLTVARGRVAKANANVPTSGYGDNRKIPMLPFKIAPIVVVVIYGLITFFSIFHTLDNGHVGLVYSFGGITGQRGDGHGGPVITYPWQSVEQANVQVQAIQPITTCYNERYTGCMEAFTMETQDVFISATINIHVDPQNIQALYRSIGPDYVEKLILPRVAQVTKEEAVKYNAIDIAPSREQLRTTIASRLTNELSARSIVVDDFLLTNVDFRDEFKASVENKVIAEQDAVTENNKIAIESAKAQQEEQKGIAEANRIREEARGQADANALISASLTPELIQFQAIQKLAPNITVIGFPVGQGTIFDVGSLMTQSDTKASTDAGIDPTPTP